MWDVLPPYERERDYYKDISKDFSYGKDIRLFNMQKFILNKEKKEAKKVHQIMEKIWCCFNVNAPFMELFLLENSSSYASFTGGKVELLSFALFTN